MLGGGILRQEEKQLRKSVVESLLEDAVRLGSYGIRTGEYSMYMNTHRRGVVTGHINEEGQQLLQSFTEAIDTKESTAIVTA